MNAIDSPTRTPWLAAATVVALLLAPGAAVANVAPDPSWAMHPSPVEPTAVQMVSESIRVRLEGDQATVTGSYVLVNPGEATTLEVGYPDIGETQGSREPEVHHEYIREFTASVDGDEVATEHRILGEPGSYVVWRAWALAFDPGQRRTVEVEFVTDTTVNADVMPAAYPGQTRPPLKRAEELRSFWYVLETGAGWGGPIGSAEIRVDAPGHGIRGVLPLGYELWGSTVRWTLTDLEPDADMGPVIVTYEPGGTTDRSALNPGKDVKRERFVMARIRRDAGRENVDLNEIARRLAIEFRRDPDWRVRRMARELFVELSPAFLALLETDADVGEVRHILRGVAEYGLTEATPTLLQRWAGAPGGPRDPVTEALAALDDTRVAPVFADLALGISHGDGRSDYPRRQAIKKLRELEACTDPAVTALIVALTDPSVHARHDALFALANLSDNTDRRFWPDYEGSAATIEEWQRAQGEWAIWWWDQRPQ
ncbi:MAG: hypothetical protein QGH45_24680 [Myxococcota bacterium]|nr:hypothetical protein [Myxococcota bacterium]